MSRMIRSAALALVLATLASAAAPALSFAGRPVPAHPEGLAAAWSWLTSWLAPLSPAVGPAKPRLAAKSTQAGPNGGYPATMYPIATTDAGSAMDPNGLK
jgi:hypothetical protein